MKQEGSRAGPSEKEVTEESSIRAAAEPERPSVSSALTWRHSALLQQVGQTVQGGWDQLAPFVAIVVCLSPGELIEAAD